MIEPEGRSNSPIIWIKAEGGYNPLFSLATTERWLKPPLLSFSNLPYVELE
jgi:hypothetical protein